MVEFTGMSDKESQQRQGRVDGPIGSVADRSAVEENRALAPETAQESPWLLPVDRQPPCAARDAVDSEELAGRTCTRSILWLANCYFAHDSSGFSVLLRFFDVNLAVLFIHFIAALARLLGPGGVRSSLLQILILNRSRKRSPHPHASDRILAGLLALLVRPTRLLRSAIVLKLRHCLAF